METSKVDLPAGTDKIFDLCANCAHYRRECSGLPKDTMFTGCVRYKRADICRYIIPGLLENWYIREDPDLSWAENRKRGERISGGIYIGPSPHDEDYLCFRKTLCQQTKQHKKGGM